MKSWYWMTGRGRHDVVVGVWWRSWSFGFYVDRGQLHAGLGPLGLTWSWGP